MKNNFKMKFHFFDKKCFIIKDINNNVEYKLSKNNAFAFIKSNFLWKFFLFLLFLFNTF